MNSAHPPDSRLQNEPAPLGNPVRAVGLRLSLAVLLSCSLAVGLTESLKPSLAAVPLLSALQPLLSALHIEPPHPDAQAQSGSTELVFEPSSAGPGSAAGMRPHRRVPAETLSTVLARDIPLILLLSLCLVALLRRGVLQPVKQLAGQVQTLRQGLRLERQRADAFREQAERHDEALRETQQVLTQKSRELDELSRQDLLTGLPNQRVFDEGLRREFKRAQRQRGCLALAVLDLDRFKNFNERYGQAAGNTALQQISSLLSEHFKRDTDFVARLGGEEFVVMLPGLALDNSQQLLEQLREELRALAIRHEGGVGVGPDGTTHVLTVSIGLAVYSPAHPYLSPQALLQAADEALYIAKHTGRDRLSRAAAKARSTERS